MRTFLMAMCMVLLSAVGMAQQKVSIAQSAQFTTLGDYNSATVAGGAKTTAARAQTVWTASASNPLYTKLDTVNNTGVDTMKGKLIGNYNGVYTWCHVNSISGTNTSCTVKLWASGDAGTGTDFVCLQTFTVSATNPVAYYTFNSGNGWLYTNFWWTFSGSGTHSSSWYSGLLVR